MPVQTHFKEIIKKRKTFKKMINFVTQLLYFYCIKRNSLVLWPLCMFKNNYSAFSMTLDQLVASMTIGKFAMSYKRVGYILFHKLECL